MLCLFATVLTCGVAVADTKAQLTTPVAGTGSSGGKAKSAEDFGRLWRNPTADYRMKTWWFFGFERTDDDGITADVEALREAGFGGVVYYDQNHARDARSQGAEDAFSPQWWQHLRRAASEARRVGLSFELNISNGYCAGGRWVDPSHAMQRVAAASMIVGRDDLGEWRTEHGNLEISGREGYVKDIALIAMPYADDGKKRHLTALYRAKGKGRNGAMQGPLGSQGGFTGYGFHPLPDIGTLQASTDSVEWCDVVRLQPMYSSQGGYYYRTSAFPATAGRFWRIHYTGEERLREWHVGSEAMLDRWEERAALHSDFADEDVTPDYSRQEVVDTSSMIVCLNPSEAVIKEPMSILPATVKAGRWRILRLAAVLTGAKSKHGRQNLLGYECDKLSDEAANLHWDSYIQVLLDSLPQGTVSGITMDSHEGGSQNWTPRMLDEFQHYQGYDFTPYLPTLAGFVVESKAKTEQVLYDYRQTIARLMQERYFGTFQRRASEHGLTFTAQAIGNALCITGDAISVKQAVEKPQGEFWTYQQQGAYDVKDCSSAAHLYGKPVASAEAMTDCEYRHTPADLHRVASIALAMGAQEFVVCATPHIPSAEVAKPYIAGREYAINRSNPRWQQMKPVWLQAARSMVMLRQGKAAPDVLVFLGDDVPIKTIDSRLPNGIDGLDWDVCTGDALMHRLEPRDGKLTTPDGIAYHALLIADKAHISAESQARLETFRKAGVAILRSGENLVRPIETIPQNRHDIAHTHRRIGRSEVFYLANLEDSATTVSFKLDDRPQRVTVWYNRSGRQTRLRSQSDGVFQLLLQPSESAFVTYEKK